MMSEIVLHAELRGPPDQDPLRLTPVPVGRAFLEDGVAVQRVVDIDSRPPREVSFTLDSAFALLGANASTRPLASNDLVMVPFTLLASRFSVRVHVRVRGN
jgi:hypothetical protein